MGVSVSSRHIPLSVARNRSKRLLLEAHRSLEGGMAGGHDIVLIARGSLMSEKVSDLINPIKAIYRKSGILKIR